MRQEENGIVDAVFITEDFEGNKIVQVKTRDLRIPELGDKFATSHGQKGIIGAIIPENDVPFTSKGVRPDIIFNPHSIPGRMTVGYLIELLAGKVGTLSGKIMDGTGFSGQKIEDLEKQLKNHRRDRDDSQDVQQHPQDTERTNTGGGGFDGQT